MELLDLVIEDIEGGTERARQAIMLGEQRRPVGANDTQIHFGSEEGDLQAVTGRGIAVRPRNAVNQSLEPQSSEIVGHVSGRFLRKLQDSLFVWQVRRR